MILCSRLEYYKLNILQLYFKWSAAFDCVYKVDSFSNSEKNVSGIYMYMYCIGKIKSDIDEKKSYS